MENKKLLDLKKSKLALLTKDKLGDIWEIYQNEFKYLFGLRLYEYAQGKHFDYTTRILPKNEIERTKIINIYRKRKGKSSSSISKQFHRLSLGYNGLTLEFTPKRCNLSSELANVNHKKKSAHDHIIGATLCAEYILQVFLIDKKSNKETWTNLDWLDDRIDFMCNDWLKDNLWLWAECRITRDEHNPQNGLVRKSVKASIFKEIKYRANLGHYEVANIKVSNYNNRTP